MASSTMSIMWPPTGTIEVWISGKTIGVKYVHGPVGVQSRNFRNRRIDSIGWRPTVSLREGLTATYTWIEQ
jgi:hypothetical protein